MNTWFTTSPFRRDARSRPDGAGARDLQLLHAKRLGTALAACGENTTTWFKFWVEFRHGSSRRTCQQCAEVVLRSGVR
jgi:hypothetical protein